MDGEESAASFLATVLGALKARFGTSEYSDLPESKRQAMGDGTQMKLVLGTAGYVFENVPHFIDYLPDLPGIEGILVEEKAVKMPGISGPSDYSIEPPRHPCLQINAKEPFNAEPPRSALVSSYVTPVDLFYKRNHGPIPVVDDIERYCVDISGLIETPKKLYMRDVRMLPKYNVTATLQCAGNRRTAMSKTRKVKGVGWDVSAIGNGLFCPSPTCN